MTDQEKLLAYLKENEDDVGARLAYADWLEEHNQPEEAERQRQWPEAKAWLVDFHQTYSHNDESEPDSERWYHLAYKRMIRQGEQSLREIQEGKSFELYLQCGADETLCDELRSERGVRYQFWTNMSILVGIPLPEDFDDDTYSSYGCAC